MGTTSDIDSSFGDVEMLGEEFNQSSVGFAVVWFSAEINSKFAGGSFDNFFLR